MTKRARETSEQFRYASGETETLRFLDYGMCWVDVVQGDGDPDDPDPRRMYDCRVIATARRIQGRRGWIVEGFGTYSDGSLPDKKAALAQLRAIIQDRA